MSFNAPQNQSEKPMEQSGKQLRGAFRLSAASLAPGFSRRTSAARFSPRRRGGFPRHARRHPAAPPRATACRNIVHSFYIVARLRRTFFHVCSTVARRAVLLDTIRNNSRLRATRSPSHPPPPPPSFCFCAPFARPRTLARLTMPARGLGFVLLPTRGGGRFSALVLGCVVRT